MTMRDRVRRWLGLDDFYAYSKQANVELARGISECATKNLIAASEKANRERHDALSQAITNTHALIASVHKQIVSEFEGINTCAEDRHGEIIELLTKLEQHFTSQHVGTRPANLPVYDWEQVQIHELAEMLANTPKDEN